jgi:phosphoglycerate-specific signal transduction histidine kinase
MSKSQRLIEAEIGLREAWAAKDKEIATLRAERDELRAALEAAQRDIELDNKSAAIGAIRAALGHDSTPHRGDFRGDK